MSATNNESNRGSPSIYRPEANAWISKRSSDLDYKGVFALIKIGFLQSSFYEVMWSSLYVNEQFPTAIRQSWDTVLATSAQC